MRGVSRGLIYQTRTRTIGRHKCRPYIAHVKQATDEGQICLPILLCVVLLSCLLSTVQAAEEGKESVVALGGSATYEYYEKEKKVVGQGRVEVTYEDVLMNCDKLVFWTETKEAIVEGNVIVYQGTTVLKGERMEYNFNTKKGNILSPHIQNPLWYGKGREGEKLPDNEYFVRYGYVTTCSLDKPHYRIQARKIYIYPDDKVVAKDVVFYINKVPIFYLPHYVQKDDRPNITIIPGRNREWGWFLLTAWRYHLNDDVRGNIRLDYRELKGWAKGLDYKYETDKLGEGLFKYYHMDERDEADEGPMVETERYRYQLRHSWQMNSETLGLLEYHHTSDKDFLKDYYRLEEYDKDPEPDSYVSITTTKPNYSLNFFTQVQVNDFETVTERLPQVKLDIREHELGETPFYYSGQTTTTYFAKEYADSLLDDEVARIDTFHKLSHPYRVMGWLGINPYIGTRQTWYSHTVEEPDEEQEEEQDDKIRGLLDSGIDVTTKFYKVLPVETNFWGLDIHQLRHVVTPTINYGYIHEPTNLSSEFLSLDETDAIIAKDKFTFTLQNALQTKRGKDKKNMKSIDIVNFIAKIDYFHNEPLVIGQNFSNLTGRLELKPYSWLYVQSDVSYNLYVDRSDTANIDFIASGGKDWDFSFGSRYIRDTNSDLVSEASYRLSPKWALRTYQRYDLETKKHVEHEYTISRDLHCWVGELSYNYKDFGMVWLTFYLKAFPKIPFDLKARYNRPKQPYTVSGE